MLLEQEQNLQVSSVINRSSVELFENWRDMIKVWVSDGFNGFCREPVISTVIYSAGEKDMDHIKMDIVRCDISHWFALELF